MSLLLTERESMAHAVIRQVIDRKITQREAARQLGISERQMHTRVKKFRSHGVKSLVHGNKGKRSPRKLADATWQHIKEYISELYYDCGPTFIAEKMIEVHKIPITRETCRTYMIQDGLWKSKKTRRKHRTWRPRKKRFGEMIQIDCSYHKWFDGDDRYYTLVAFIDDATSTIVHLEFIEAEATMPLLQALHAYVKRYGRPQSIYSDKGSVYAITTHNEDKMLLSNFHKSCAELDIELIHAHSPQAKGRVERLFRTLQDRLVKELRTIKITTQEDANRFLAKTYIDQHNQRFAVPPAHPQNAHRPSLGYNLEHILATRELRSLRNDWTISHKGTIIQVEQNKPLILQPKDKIEVRISHTGEMLLFARNKKLSFTPLNERKPKARITKPLKQGLWVPPKEHPWRRSYK